MRIMRQDRNPSERREKGGKSERERKKTTGRGGERI